MASPYHSDAKIRELEQNTDVISGQREMLREWRSVTHKFQEKMTPEIRRAQVEMTLADVQATAAMTADELRAKDDQVDAGESWLAEMERAIKLKCPAMAAKCMLEIWTIHQRLNLHFDFIPQHNRNANNLLSRIKKNQAKAGTLNEQKQVEAIELANAIRDAFPRIKAAELKKNPDAKKLTIETAVCDEFGCAVSTVRRAMNRKRKNRGSHANV